MQYFFSCLVIVIVVVVVVVYIANDCMFYAIINTMRCTFAICARINEMNETI